MSYASVILTDTPQAYYRCAETSGTVAHDSSGHGFNGTLVGVTAYGAAGALSGDSNTALSFSATGGVLLPSSLGYTSWSAFSLECWIKVSGGDGWHYIVVTTDGNTTILYRDTVVMTSGVGSGPDVLLGALYNWIGPTGSATLDEIAVYSTQLSTTRIHAHYTAAIGGGSGSGSGTPTTLSMPTSAAWGFNYYHESMGYFGGTYSGYSADLAAILPSTQKIKVYHNPLPQNAGGFSRSATLTLCQNIVTAAKASGFYVVWVENIDQGRVLTDATTDLSNPGSYKWKWADYSAQVLLDAQAAQTVGADEFVVGNEIQGSTHYYATDPGTGLPTTIYSGTTFPSYVSTLVNTCKRSFAGLVGYQEVHTVDRNWTGSGLPNGGRGNVDMLYFDLYDEWSTFQAKAQSLSTAFGSHVALGEVSSIDVLGNIGHYTAYTESDWARELIRRYDFARQVGIPFYIFAYGDPNTNGYGFTTNHSTYHDVWTYVTGSKTLGYTQYLADTFPPNDFSGGSGGTGGELDVTSTATFAQTAAPGSDYVYRGACIGHTGTGSLRMVARYTDANTYYALDLNIGTSTVSFLRRQGGIETILGTPVVWPPQGSFVGTLNAFTLYDFEIRVQGTGASTQVAAFFNTYKLCDQVDTGNTSLGSSTVGVRYNGLSGGVQHVILSSLETVNTNGGGGGISIGSGNPFGLPILGMARVGDGKMTAIRGHISTLPISYTISPSKYARHLGITYTIMRANVASLLLYYWVVPPQTLAINGDGTIIAPDRITYAPRPVIARQLLAAPIIQGYKVMTWQYSQIEPDKWAHLVSYYDPQNPLVLLTYPDDTGFWRQSTVRMLPPVWGSWETMLVSNAQLSFVIVPPS